jgi:CheY-like chemotaxis protein
MVKHNESSVRFLLKISYDPAEQLLYFTLKDNGPGFFHPGFLREAFEGITITSESFSGSTKAGLIFRGCRLIAEDILEGLLIGETDHQGTRFLLGVKADPSHSSSSDTECSGPGSLVAAVESEIVHSTDHLINGEGAEGKEGATSRHRRNRWRLSPLCQPASVAGSAPTLDSVPAVASSERADILIPLEEVLGLHEEERSPSAPQEGDRVRNSDIAAVDRRIPTLFPFDAPVLVVDDEAVSRRMLENLLRRGGWPRVSSTTSAAESIDRVSTSIVDGTPYAFIFMDQVLTDGAGNKVAEQIFKMYESAGLNRPIIIPATGNDSPSDIANYEASGMTCEAISFPDGSRFRVLSKPYDIRLLACLREKYFAPAPSGGSASAEAPSK